MSENGSIEIGKARFKWRLTAVILANRQLLNARESSRVSHLEGSTGVYLYHRTSNRYIISLKPTSSNLRNS